MSAPAPAASSRSSSRFGVPAADGRRPEGEQREPDECRLLNEPQLTPTGRRQELDDGRPRAAHSWCLAGGLRDDVADADDRGQGGAGCREGEQASPGRADRHGERPGGMCRADPTEDEAGDGERPDQPGEQAHAQPATRDVGRSGDRLPRAVRRS